MRCVPDPLMTGMAASRMEEIMITSLHNKSVKEVSALIGKKRERDRQGLFVIEGAKMFGEAPVERISRVYIAQGVEKEMYARYGEKLSGLSCEIVADEVFDRMSDTVTPQGILCLVRQRHYNIEEMLQNTDKKQMLFIILEDIQDPGNLGTIFRTAEAAGADGVIMSSRTADIYNPKTLHDGCCLPGAVSLCGVASFRHQDAAGKGDSCLRRPSGRKVLLRCARISSEYGFSHRKRGQWPAGGNGGLCGYTSGDSDGGKSGVAECGGSIFHTDVRGLQAEKKWLNQDLTIK